MSEFPGRTPAEPFSDVHIAKGQFDPTKNGCVRIGGPLRAQFNDRVRHVSTPFHARSVHPRSRPFSCSDSPVSPPRLPASSAPPRATPTRTFSTAPASSTPPTPQPASPSATCPPSSPPTSPYAPFPMPSCTNPPTLSPSTPSSPPSSYVHARAPTHCTNGGPTSPRRIPSKVPSGGRQNVVGNSGDPLIEGIWASASNTGGMLHPDHCCGRASLGGMVGVGYGSPTR